MNPTNASPTPSLFLSAVSDEFESFRKKLREHLDFPGVRIETQESLVPDGRVTLLTLDDCIRHCHAVVHLTGRRTGSAHNDGVASKVHVDALLARYPDLPNRLGQDEAFLRNRSYTQWEAWIALYHDRRLFIATAEDGVTPDKPLSDPARAAVQATSQAEHLAALRGRGHYANPKLAFGNWEILVIRVLRALRDLLPPVTIPISDNLPPSLGSLFKGRDDVLAEIRRAFTGERHRGPLGCTAVAVWGMGGLGKTRLAVEYAHAFAHECSAVLFVSASNREELESGLAGLTGALRLDAAHSPDLGVRLRAALDWLGSPQNKGWFLILDNIDDESALDAVLAVLGKVHHGRILLTGRTRRWLDAMVELELDVLQREHSVEYLLDYTTRHRIGTPTDRAEADALAHELGDLALGLNQAAFSIKKRALSFADYLAEWRSNRPALLDDPDFDPKRTGYPRTVAITWLTSYRQLPPLSAVVFDALCWMAPDPIPERLVSQAWPPGALAALPTDLQAGLPARRADLLVPLFDTCLAQPPRSTRRLIEIHRLVQDVGRRRQLKDGSAGQRLALAWALVAADFIRPDTIENLTLHILPDLRETAPHGLALLEWPEPRVGDDGRSHFLRVLADMRWDEGRSTEALELARESVRVAERLPQENANHSSVLGEALSTQCCHCCVVGEHSEGETAGERAVQIWTDLTSRFPDEAAYQRELSIAYNNVGRIRESQGEYAAALKVFLRSQEIGERLVMAEPTNLAHQRDLSIAYNNVGRIRERQGEYPQALEVFLRSQEIRERLVKAELSNLAHQRDLSIACSNVGRIREKQGECAAALEVFLRSQEIRERLMKAEPTNLGRQRELYLNCFWCGRVLHRLGPDRFPEARRHLTRARDLASALLRAGFAHAGVDKDLKAIESELAKLPRE